MTFSPSRYVFGIFVSIAILAGCGESQPLIGAPGAMPRRMIDHV
jgi:hypothetical protein